MGKKRKRESWSQDEEDIGRDVKKEEDISTTEYFFDVRKDLKELFNSVEGGEEFSFLGGKQPDEADEIELKKPKVEKKRSKKNFDIALQDLENRHEQVTKYFFFHANSTHLRNRLDDNSFVRTQSLEQLEADWPDKRRAMKSSFRKRSKEVMKIKKRKYWTGSSNA